MDKRLQVLLLNSFKSRHNQLPSRLVDQLTQILAKELPTFLQYQSPLALQEISSHLDSLSNCLPLVKEGEMVKQKNWTKHLIINEAAHSMHFATLIRVEQESEALQHSLIEQNHLCDFYSQLPQQLEQARQCLYQNQVNSTAIPFSDNTTQLRQTPSQKQQQNQQQPQCQEKWRSSQQIYLNQQKREYQQKQQQDEKYQNQQQQKSLLETTTQKESEKNQRNDQLIEKGIDRFLNQFQSQIAVVFLSNMANARREQFDFNSTAFSSFNISQNDRLFFFYQKMTKYNNYVTYNKDPGKSLLDTQLIVAGFPSVSNQQRVILKNMHLISSIKNSIPYNTWKITSSLHNYAINYAHWRRDDRLRYDLIIQNLILINQLAHQANLDLRPLIKTCGIEPTFSQQPQRLTQLVSEQ